MLFKKGLSYILSYDIIFYISFAMVDLFTKLSKQLLQVCHLYKVRTKMASSSGKHTWSL